MTGRPKFRVTFFDSRAGCGYSGKWKRSRPEAFASALIMSSQEFLDLGKSDRDTFYDLYETAVENMGRATASWCRAANSGRSIRIERRDPC